MNKISKAFAVFIVCICIVGCPGEVFGSTSEPVNKEALLKIEAGIKEIENNIAKLRSERVLGISISKPITHPVTLAKNRHDKKIRLAKSCGNGNDFYDGGQDIDTLLYSGKRAEFFITQHTDGSFTFKDLVSCRVDTDTVINIELFKFSDGTVKVENLRPDAYDKKIENKKKRENLSISSVVFTREVMDGGVYAPEQELTVIVGNNEYGPLQMSDKKINYTVEVYDVTKNKKKKTKILSAGEFVIPSVNGYSEFNVNVEGGLPYDGKNTEKKYKALVKIDTGKSVTESNEKDNSAWSDSWQIEHYKG